MPQTYWLLLIVQFYLYGVGWLLAILLLKSMRRLLWQHSLSALLLATGMLLSASLPADMLRQPWPYTLVSALLIAGFLYAANASLLFLRLHGYRHRDILLGTLVAAAPILLLGLTGKHELRLALLSVQTGCILLMVTWQMHQRSLKEFPGIGTWLLHASSALFGCFFLLRAVLRLMFGEAMVPELYSSSVMNTLQAVAFMVMAAIFNLTASVRIGARMARQLHKLSLHDQLTTLQNRRALHTKLTEAYLQQFSCFSVIVLDIDHFKLINDRYGHSMGDVVLSRIGRLLKQHHTELSQAFRLGGEEFAIVLPGGSQADALQLAEVLRQAIESKPLMRQGQILTITASFGIASSSATEQKLVQVLDTADRAMYSAKQSGRNRICHEHTYSLEN
ncbi:GGDEF domain-containing protein [Vogesella mureinivorans]|uniref:GGDEF domain-containing protein n=1 Tax=Vogesella mureinivorans TaxID=657276 RepID=UPI0011CC226E|nr:GGDEF domain-containing protein [Vogesella mureinivorans]